MTCSNQGRIGVCSVTEYVLTCSICLQGISCGQRRTRSSAQVLKLRPHICLFRSLSRYSDDNVFSRIHSVANCGGFRIESRCVSPSTSTHLDMLRLVPSETLGPVTKPVLTCPHLSCFGLVFPSACCASGRRPCSAVKTDFKARYRKPR